jgi:phospholipid-binding lipoprotein MlaA
MRVKANTALAVLILLLSLSVLPGCASKKAATAPLPADEDAPAQIADPLEPWNRFWFSFNDVFYTGFGKPFSKAYTFLAPKYVRDRIENAYANILFPVRFVNALLQLRPDKASREFGRFMVNSTFGLGGLYDLAATGKDLKSQRLDFGQTLGVWGMGHGFYLVLPFIGPSSLRDGVGTAVDIAIMPTSYVDVPYLLTVGIGAAGRINRIPEMLDLYEELKRSAFEPYVAARDAYAQIRAKMVSDSIASAWVKAAAEPAQ